MESAFSRWPLFLKCETEGISPLRQAQGRDFRKHSREFAAKRYSSHNLRHQPFFSSTASSSSSNTGSSLNPRKPPARVAADSVAVLGGATAARGGCVTAALLRWRGRAAPLQVAPGETRQCRVASLCGQHRNHRARSGQGVIHRSAAKRVNFCSLRQVRAQKGSRFLVKCDPPCHKPPSVIFGLRAECQNILDASQ